MERVNFKVIFTHLLILKNFFKQLEHNYGKTALCLSGGALFGLSHLGLLSELIKHECLPKVVTGSSSGSLITVLIGSNTLDELKELSKNNFK